MIFLKTQRLNLRNVEPADIPEIVRYRNNENCGKYQRWDHKSTVEVSKLISSHCNDLFLSDKPEQHYAISTHDGCLIGDLSCFHNNKDACITLGITISPSNQRKHYGFEILSEVISHIRCHYLNFDLVALIEPENDASIFLFEKLGFIRECYAESISSFVYCIYGS